MNTMSVIEYTLAFAFGISLVGLLPWYKSKGSDKWPVFCLFFSVLWLVVDASAYHLLEHQETPFALRYIVDLLAYALGSFIFIFFIKFREDYVRERMDIGPWLFRAPIVLLALNVLAIIVSFVSGGIVVFENGIEIADNGMPLYASIVWMLVLLHLPCVAWAKRAVLGKRAVMLFCLDLLPFAASAIALFTGRDFTVALGSLEIFLVIVFFQKIKADENRILSDKQILLDYFVDQYWSACIIDLKNETLEVLRADNANTHAYVMDGTTEDMRRFIDSRFHPDDRAMMYQITDKDYIRKKLKDRASLSYTAREIIDSVEKTMRILIVRCADVDHVAVGFMDITAEIEKEKKHQEEIFEAKRIIEQSIADDLANQQRNMKSFGDMINAALWSMIIDEEDEVISVNWSDEYRHMFGFEKTEADFPNTIEAWSSRLHPEDKENTLRDFTESIKSRNTDDFIYDREYRIQRKSGEYCWYHSVGRMENNADGTRKMFGIIIDISSDKKLEEEQKRNDIIHDIIHSGKWSFFVNSDDKIVKSYYSEEVKSVINTELSSGTTEWTDILHPEDKEAALTAFNATIADHSCRTPYDVSYRMKDRNGEYHWFHSAGRIVRDSDGNGEFFGVHINITEQVNEQKRRDMEAEESRKLVDSIASSYNIAFVVCMKTDAYRVLRTDESVTGCAENFRTFTEVKEHFISLLPGADQARMRRELDYDTIRRKLQNINSYNIEYRVPINNTIIWHIMNVTAIDIANDYVSIGFEERDLEITQKHLEDKRYSEYFALYEIDIDSGMMKIVKDSPYYRLDRSGTSIPFVPTMMKFASRLEGETREFFERFVDLDYAKERFATEDKLTYAYRSKNENLRQWVDCTCYVTLRHDDGTPAMVTFGFSFLDSLGVYRQELQEKYVEQNAELRKNMQMIGGLASGYNALYYININEHILHIYALDEEKYPGSNEIFKGDRADFYNIIGGYGLSEQVHPDDRYLFKDFGPEWIRKMLTGRKKYSMRFRAATDTGYRWDEMELTKYEGLDEEANAVAVGFTDRDSDIRKEQEYQKQLETAREAADAANQSKSSFLFNMSHDIRTPMNAIRGFTTMAKKNAGDEAKVNDYLDKIDVSGQQLLTLINQVLEMARIESGKIEFEEIPVNIHEEFYSMVTVLNEQAKAKGLVFEYSLDNVEHNYVLADEARMSSITLNIAGNAMKYTPEGGSIEFTLKEITSRRPEYASFVFTVSDTGIGMSPEYLKELYEPFSREKSSTVSKIQGTGLGLSIVKNTVDLMGGNIEVQSEIGKGTRFDITVDFRIDAKAGQKKEDNENVEMVSFEGRRVLLVEDNEMNREIAKDILEEQGIIVEDADDGDVAVAMVQAVVNNGEFHYYDFILMDVQMPRMNGYEATRAIRAIPGPEGVHIPIIAMTANAFEEDRQNALAAGMDEHLAKPIDVNKAFRTIAKFLK